ncbi:MAG: DnaJ domain-containing protein [Paludibacteraceae bacterium]|nr:DnaJ domain-containing protein [Paludibacteraceae bacterium]
MRNNVFDIISIIVFILSVIGIILSMYEYDRCLLLLSIIAFGVALNVTNRNTYLHAAFISTIAGIIIGYSLFSPIIMLPAVVLCGIYGGLVISLHLQDNNEKKHYFEHLKYLDDSANNINAYSIGIPFLFSMVVRSDGNITDSEREKVFDFFKRKFPKECFEMNNTFKLTLGYHATDYKKYCATVLAYADKVDETFPLDLFYALYDIASDDGCMVQEEADKMRQIGKTLRIDNEIIRQMEHAHGIIITTTDKEESKAELRKKALQTLGLNDDADDYTIKLAYNTLVQKCHPHKMKGKSTAETNELLKRFEQIQTSYDILFMQK